MRRLLFIGMIYCFTSVQAYALTMSPLFSDHMVLQRDEPVRVWGQGPAHQQVTVILLGKRYQTQAGVDGQWQVMLPAHSKIGPFTLSVIADETITINDVFYGEVWIASGQSNMEWKLKGNVVDHEQEIASANRPLIRFFDVPDTLAASKQIHLPLSQWQLASPDSAGYFSAVAWFFARKLQEHEQVAVGIIESNWGGTPAESWMDLSVVVQTPGYEQDLAKIKMLNDRPELEDDLAQQSRIRNGTESPKPVLMDYSLTASFVYNAMIHPLLPYTAKGVIWYQGESNVNKHKYYHALFSNLIESWRNRAQAPDMPFLFVQIAAYLPASALQAESEWAYLRDAQRQTLSIANTGMAVAIDVGSANDIHPKQKREVGERLWRQAAAKVYGIPIVASGPDFRQMEIDQNHVVLHFNYAEGFTTRDKEPLQGFIIAGDDRVFRIANAYIKGDTVELSHPEISQPVAVRYAWADNPIANLINGANLPAVPFRTDVWPANEVNTK